FHGGAGAMWLQHDIVEVPKRFWRVGFVGEHIEPGAAQATLDQRTDECRLIDNTASGYIDQNSIWPERVEDASADEASRPRTTCGRHDEKVAPAYQRFQVALISVFHVTECAQIVVRDQHTE